MSKSTFDHFELVFVALHVLANFVHPKCTFSVFRFLPQHYLLNCLISRRALIVAVLLILYQLVEGWRQACLARKPPLMKDNWVSWVASGNQLVYLPHTLMVIISILMRIISILMRIPLMMILFLLALITMIKRKGQPGSLRRRAYLPHTFLVTLINSIGFIIIISAITTNSYVIILTVQRGRL